MKKGDLLILGDFAVIRYKCTSCVFLGYRELYGRTYIVGLAAGKKMLFLGEEINYESW